MNQAKHRIQVWDLPIRLFHWCLVILVGALFATASLGALEVHELAGKGVLDLVVFRLIWGVVGSQTARFSDFLGGFTAIRQYLVYRQSKSLGHNPLGGWMVAAMLAVLLIQAATGLLANDGILFQGPLAHNISQSLSDVASSAHLRLANLLGGLIAIHITAILLYWFVGRENLVAPMFTGTKWITAPVKPVQFVSLILAVAIQCVVLPATAASLTGH